MNLSMAVWVEQYQIVYPVVFMVAIEQRSGSVACRVRPRLSAAPPIGQSTEG